MKQDDVFIADGKEPLFIAETVTPSGAVYARKFDIHKGSCGGVEAFPANTEFKILFNSLGRSGSFAEVKIGSATLEDFVISRKESFQALAAKPEETLEDKMRPGAYSQGGFLGAAESLDLVLAQDEQILKKLGITFKEIAGKLEQIVKVAVEKENRSRSPEFQKRAQYFPSGILISHENLSEHDFGYSIENLPEHDLGYSIDQYQIFISGTKGLQECPWDCPLENTWGSFVFLLLNRQTGEYIVAPGLIVHLIREHHFFEGNESPYRVEPLKLAQVLGLA